MSERTWRMIPRNRPLSFLYLLAGVLLAFNSVNQLKNDMAVLPLISGLAAVGLIAVAVVGLARPSSHPRTR
ncbi:hypothetical protein ACH4Y0_41215 [Streptomyces sp. NPDC020707]|jgi:hypothetical protein|uniref:DUF3098 domain-containing protein n=1 Tax=Streptomyces ortus TaxID=2867268 RepID=A0ABT3VKB8_9ACTN|nr:MULTISPECIES: hypothetical protein [Streptomyces]MCX4238753.1 hypothetical protein [Streptomyces ortus]